MAPPFRIAEVDIMYGEGISREGEILDIGSEVDIVQKSGSWFSYNGERLGQGRENAKVFLKKTLKLEKKLEKTLLILNMVILTTIMILITIAKTKANKSIQFLTLSRSVI